ncbi:hypothetical protein CV_1877 [Chromobacterium violaceum ATCC 12472]|uniref:Uncharacterized protein n=1 Tax=Chromobacterium violaceum (strain ATCC 12472 / DSM 30191 / JCM 1249 / CCUG 213 / NBRC 12614 / NCIMB 9131 / NCTC 9757 / MK) TaxID=243365 RepID=Q7NWV2_CHRVO|nr:hypothetical protein CV_1877 [Chromobacterium violaceum ATCC 12472]
MRRLIVFSASNGFSSVFFSCLLFPDFSEIFFLSLINAERTSLISGCPLAHPFSLRCRRRSVPAHRVAAFQISNY